MVAHNESNGLWVFKVSLIYLCQVPVQVQGFRDYDWLWFPRLWSVPKKSDNDGNQLSVSLNIFTNPKFPFFKLKLIAILIIWQEDSPKVEEKKESDTESVKDAWDAESSEDETEPQKAQEPQTPVKEDKRSAPTQDKGKEVCTTILYSCTVYT